jgi:hypothetical protein
MLLSSPGAKKRFIWVEPHPSGAYPLSGFERHWAAPALLAASLLYGKKWKACAMLSSISCRDREPWNITTKPKCFPFLSIGGVAQWKEPNASSHEGAISRLIPRQGTIPDFVPGVY